MLKLLDPFNYVSKIEFIFVVSNQMQFETRVVVHQESSPNAREHGKVFDIIESNLRSKNCTKFVQI